MTIRTVVGGERHGSDSPFRKWCGLVGELRSILPVSVPVLALTATASLSTRKKLIKQLGLVHCLEIVRNLHALNNNHCLTTAAATAASNAGILSRRRYIHRGSGHNRHRTLHYPKGTNIPSLWTNSRPHVNTTHRTSNLSNLRSPPPAPLSITFALLNTRSLTNKSPVISELILDNNIDFLLLTETWQQPSDYYALNQATPINYCYIAKPRSSGRGGGIAVLHKQSLSVTELDLNLPPIYLASGDSQQSLAFSYRMAKSTVGLIIEETCTALWEALHHQVLKVPDEREWMNIAAVFNEVWNFPNCCGAIDGKHCIIQAPANAGSTFYNYKGTHSIVLLAVCDARYRFSMVDIGCPGRHSDGGVLSSSVFGRKLQSGDLGFPGATNLPRSAITVPHVLVGDEAFPLRQNLMRPFPGRFLPEPERVFNYRLSRARRIIENSFGILSTRWRVYRKPIHCKINRAIAVVKATVCLHNSLRDLEVELPVNNRSYCPPNATDSEDVNGNVVEGSWRQEEERSCLQDIPRVGANTFGADASAIRQKFRT
ncbi:hypothetical protein SKAU_G00093780 [Synaphobranchus kaupii]|uniref:DDE Tnp4 domain-containing protein n=1 Tax=Synaphobranchus kaupii TaxID=118154 RepID=A0A9Q1FX72_SYNKA|nr:hypothetical protein SKAU_G00093780 [Synaphobranchus kaupii]